MPDDAKKPWWDSPWQIVWGLLTLWAGARLLLARTGVLPPGPGEFACLVHVVATVVIVSGVYTACDAAKKRATGVAGTAAARERPQ